MSSYQQDGYLLVRQAIPPADLEPLCTCIMRYVNAYAHELLEAGKISNLYEELPFGKRLAALHAGNDLHLRSWDEPAFGPELHALIHHPSIIDTLVPLLGPNISFNGSYQLRPKMPYSQATAFPLHSDSQYFGKPSHHAHVIKFWIPIVDVDEANGCLYVIPGSHHWEFIDSARDEDRNMHSFEDVEARGTPVAVPMKRGDILCFGVRTFHGSKVNRSDGVRWNIELKYCRTRGTYTASSKEQEGEDFMYNKRKSFVVRGQGPRCSFEQWQAQRNA